MLSQLNAMLLSVSTLSASPKPLLAKASLYRRHLPCPRWHLPRPLHNAFTSTTLSTKPLVSKEKRVADSRTLLCSAGRRQPTASPTTTSSSEDNNLKRRVLQIALWIAEAVYILWLFLLPYAPGDPVWSISPETVNSLVNLSLNFFFILPFTNFVGIHLINAPVLHPMSEGLFNFVIGWTFMFAPLLFTDRNRDRYKGSLDLLWGFQMFLTNTFLIPYMAIRLNDADNDDTDSVIPIERYSKLGSVMTNGAAIVGLIGGGVCIVSLLWALFGRMDDGNFGGIVERWEYLVGYLGSERLAYAFIWDICLYAIFQPWLIGDNLQNLQETKVAVVKYLRFVPMVGLIAYLLCLEPKER